VAIPEGMNGKDLILEFGQILHMGLFSWMFGKKTSPHGLVNEMTIKVNGLRHNIRLAESYRQQGNIPRAKKHYDLSLGFLKDLKSHSEALEKSIKNQEHTIAEMQKLEIKKQKLQE